MKKTVALHLAAAALALIALASGCVVPTRRGGLAIIAPVPGRGVSVLKVAPPPVPKVVVPRPAAAPVGHVWIEGHWTIEGGKYVWKAGYWGRPPRSGAVWVPARTVKVGVEWRHTPGYWK